MYKVTLNYRDPHCMQLGKLLTLRGGIRTVTTQSISQSRDELKAPPVASFQHSKIGNTFLQKPVYHNPYLSDSLLKSYLARHVPKQYFEVINADLTRFGDRISTEIYERGLECERNPPTLTQYDAYGRRIDQINTCNAWKFMKTVSAEEGLIAIGYERNYGEASRLYQMAKLFLFGSSSGLYSCPLSMADGAAKVLESTIKNAANDDGIFGTAYRRLTSRDPTVFWTSGQWMTEKGGGSDVANGTETIAHRQPDGSYTLHGYKWFTSATDADMALTLARIADENGHVTEGTRGLSLFFLETRCQGMDSGLNGIQVQRLKDKLGTRQLPTAEMLLDGTVAYQLGEPGRGVRHISGMLTITRVYNSLMATSGMRQLTQLAVDYSTKRTVFGSKLCDNPLHVQTLARMDVETRAACLLNFEIIRLLGLTEIGMSSAEDDGLLRLLTPVCKLYTAKQALQVSTEGLESFGGLGYLEDSGLPRNLRDAQVLSIWEGTTNVLSMDVLRAIEKSGGEVLINFFSRIGRILEQAKSSGKFELTKSIKSVETASKNLSNFVSNMQGRRKSEIVVAARDMSYSISRVYMAALLLEHATWDGAVNSDVHAIRRWCTQDLCPVATSDRLNLYNSDTTTMDKSLLFDSHQGEI